MTLDSFCNDAPGPWENGELTSCFMDSVLLGSSLILVTIYCAFYILLSFNDQTAPVNFGNEPDHNREKNRKIELVCMLGNILVSLVCVVYYLAIDSLTFDYRVFWGMAQALAWTSITYATQIEHNNNIIRSGFINNWCLFHIALSAYKSYFVTNRLGDEFTAIDVCFLISLLLLIIIAGFGLVNLPATGSYVYSSLDETTKPSPEPTSSIASWLTFSWMSPIMLLGFIRPLADSDIWSLREHDRSDVIHEKFEENWKEQMGLDQPSVMKALIKTYWKPFAVAGVLKLFSDIFSFVGPQILRLVVEYTEDETIETHWGYIYALVFFLTTIAQSLLQQRHSFMCSEIGVQIRVSLAKEIYQKSFLMSPKALEAFPVGSIVNLVSSDAQNFIELMPYVHLIWSAPLLIALSIFFLYQVVDYAVFAGLGCIIVMVLASGYIATEMSALQSNIMEKKDGRTKILSEVLNGIKIIKLYCWERSFQRSITNIRDEEIVSLRTYKYLSCAITFVWYLTPIAVTVVTFSTYTALGGELSAAKAFTAIALFEVLRTPLVTLPFMISGIAEVNISLERISGYLLSENHSSDTVERSFNTDLEAELISVDSAFFSWDGVEPFLENINIKVGREEIVAVTGRVGAGKTSLIEALLGRMQRQSGHVALKGNVAYAPQRPWIQNATLKDNILFGKEYDKEWYDRVIFACALQQDLDLLPAGDLTEIGERGINLSGGQKQRVSIARAVYSRADVYLFDDPLSAVDVHVGGHIFEHVLSRSSGILKNNAVLLVTHGLQYLPEVSSIVHMKNGRILKQGSYQSLIQTGFNFDSSSDLSRGGSVDSLDKKEKNEPEKEKPEAKKAIDVDEFSDDEDEMGRIISKENRQYGRVSSEVYLVYARSFGILSVLGILFALISIQITSVGSDLWLSLWAEDDQYEDFSNETYIAVYIAFGFGQGLSTLLTSYLIYFAGLKTSLQLHAEMLFSILRSPMSFFDTTPVGRILNRFGKDQNIVDDGLPMSLEYFLEASFDFITALIVVAVTLPYMISLLLPLSIVYFYLRNYYIATSREIQRLESISRSPVLSYLSETINGLHVINAFRYQELFLKSNSEKLDHNHAVYHPKLGSQGWLAIRLEFLANIIVTATFVFVVLERGSISPGLAGFALKYALTVTECLDWVVRASCETETNIVAVERMKEFTDLPPEAPQIVRDNRPPDNWPEKGQITFDKLSLRYRPGLDLVLKGVNCSIRSGEKIGICGRTGAGKSTLTLALFRILEPAEGTVLIDDIDICKIGLDDLRSKLAIIPQDPFLFRGTVRINLDPFGNHSDEEIWNSLKTSHLHDYVQSLPGKLDYLVTENGENLSSGQRQLMCLARALLKKTSILILDEATATVDFETDAFVQETIKKAFQRCTVLTIAHRINTIIDCDRVMVFDKGQLAEFDSPTTLMQNPQSLFASLVGSSAM